VFTGTAVRGQVVEPSIAQPDLARVELLEPGDAAQQGGLAAARGAEKHEELARGDRQAHVVEGAHRSPLGGLVGLARTQDAQRRPVRSRRQSCSHGASCSSTRCWLIYPARSVRLTPFVYAVSPFGSL
jgi:hypothetical protein